MCDLTTFENFIDGQFHHTENHIASVDPSNGQIWARVPDSGAKEVGVAVAAAKRAFKSWSSLPAFQRAGFLLKVADLIEARLDQLAEIESRDQGKPVWLARSVDIPRAVHNFRHFAHTIPHQLNTSKTNVDTSTINYTVRSPVGVAGLISPWNLPLYLLTFKMAPALATGNTVVAKPSEMTSATAFELCKIFQEAGLPAGVVNVVFGLGEKAGAALVEHPDVPLISFTGSTLTGSKIASVAAPLFKKLSLELGGKNAALVFNDCDLEAAVGSLTRSSFINQGQVCLCTSRIYVQCGIYDQFIKLFVEKTRALKVGNPKDPNVFMGALNSKPHLEKVRSYLSLAATDGGKMECGESVEKLHLKGDLREGFYLLPTIITGLKDDSRCMTEEIFGPVTCVAQFEGEDEVIERANATQYGLCANVWTKDIAKAHRMSNALEVGTVWTNCWMVRDLDLPFGGVKKSGMGREGTTESLDFYTEVKTICTCIK